MATTATHAVDGFTIDDLTSSIPFNQPVRASSTSPDAPVKVVAKKGARAKKVKNETNENGEGSDADVEPTTPKAPVKRTRKLKAAAALKGEDEDEEMEDAPPAPKSGNKRISKTAVTESPAKKAKGNPSKNGAGGRKVKAAAPTCWEEFNDEEKMIVQMRREGSNWLEIEAKWKEMTGAQPGKDVIRKKFSKLDAVATIWAEGDDKKLLAAKLRIEPEIEEMIKKLRAEKWAKIADGIRADGGGAYKPAAVEKKFEYMVSKKLVDDAGKYTGDCETASTGAAADSDTNGVKSEDGNGAKSEDGAKSEEEDMEI